MLEEEDQSDVEDSGAGTDAPAEEKKVYHCKQCEFSSDDPLVLGRHVNQAHPKPAPPGGFKCDQCNFTSPTPRELGAHKKWKHPKQQEGSTTATTTVREQAPPPPSGEETKYANIPQSEEDIRSWVAIEGRSALNKLKRQRLEEVLSKYPRISAQAKELIMWKWDIDEQLQDDSQKLSLAIINAGIPDTIAYDIVGMVFALEEKYGPSLRQVRMWPGGSYYQQDRGYSIPPYAKGREPTGAQPQYMRSQQQQGQRQPEYMQPNPYQSPYYDPFYPYSPYPSYPSSAGDPAITGLKEEVKELKNRFADKDKEKVLTIAEPVVDEYGEVCIDAEGHPITTPVVVPASMLPTYFQSKKSIMMPRGRGEHEPAPPTVPPDVQRRLDQLEAENKESKNKMETMRDEMHKQEMQGIRDALEDVKAENRAILATTRSGDYKNDSVRLIAESAKEVTGFVKDRKPINELLDFLKKTQQTPSVATETTPALAEQEKTASSLIEEELKQRGWIKS